ncbi:MAG: KpsF/GutQ family sugar-phosphate isomerase [Flavobacteriales bacterium]|nr:KpsF/GutQ family sugar-phosphate isomerase [Flavobacteriales bacterium]
MKSKEDIIAIGRQVINRELQAISSIPSRIGDDFASCIGLILNSRGRIIITGIGKSAHVAGKIVATLNSTGSPAIFMHAADAVHGDLGIVQKDDIVLCLSKSGETPEIKALIPLIKSRGHKLVAMVGQMNSYLARESDLVLDTSVDQEACPNNLAPTTSTTAQMIMGDALAVTLLECRGFTKEDFARVHPGGALGKQLYLKVDDIYKGNEKPVVQPETPLKQAIVEISSKRLGMTAVINHGKLVGVITDGDLRRMLESNRPIDDLTAADIMNTTPKSIAPSALAVAALEVMEKFQITQLVVAENDQYLGVIHLHDLLREGIL